MVKNILSPALGRRPEDLEDLLLFGSVDHYKNKIDTLCNVGVKRIHFWPIWDFNEQIEIFSRDCIKLSDMCSDCILLTEIRYLKTSFVSYKVSPSVLKVKP
jgi:hypothetical protein